MKKILFTVLTAAITFSAAAAFAEDPAFNDISGHWAENTIERYANKGVISGYEDGSFKPDDHVTRAEADKIISLGLNLLGETQPEYDDVSTDAWYYPYLKSCAKYIPNYALPFDYESNKPYVEAYEQGRNSFLPQADAIRMHIAEALVLAKSDLDESISTDVPDINTAQEAVESVFKDSDYTSLYPSHGKVPTNISRMINYTYLANKYDLMQGDSDGYFKPYDYITRAELLTVIDRAVLYEKTGLTTDEVINNYELYHACSVKDTLKTDKYTFVYMIGSTPHGGYGMLLKINSDGTMIHFEKNFNADGHGALKFDNVTIDKENEKVYFYHDKSYVLDLKTDLLTEDPNKTAVAEETATEEGPGRQLTREEVIDSYLSADGYNADVKEKFETDNYTFLYFVRGDSFAGNEMLVSIDKDGISQFYSDDFQTENSDELKKFANVTIDKENETVSLSYKGKNYIIDLKTSKVSEQ